MSTERIVLPLARMTSGRARAPMVEKRIRQQRPRAVRVVDRALPGLDDAVIGFMAQAVMPSSLPDAEPQVDARALPGRGDRRHDNAVPAKPALAR